MISKIREVFPFANITAIDYDPSATAVNQENRIKLMLATAKRNLDMAMEQMELPKPDFMARFREEMHFIALSA